MTIEANFSSLEICKAFAEDAGTYTAVASNLGGEESTSCLLTVTGGNSPSAQNFWQNVGPDAATNVWTTRTEPAVGEEAMNDEIEESFATNVWTMRTEPAVGEELMDDQIEESSAEAAPDRLVSLSSYPSFRSDSNTDGVPMAPKFTKSIHDVNVGLGESYTVQATISGYPKPEVSMFKTKLSRSGLITSNRTHVYLIS